MVKMYTTHCPKCKVLQEKLQAAGVEFQEITDTNEMTAKGIDTVPMLEVGAALMNFTQAVHWINNRK